MKLRFVVVTILFVSLVTLGTSSVARAQWNAIGSGYAVTTDLNASADILGQASLIGSTVTATAGTTDSEVKEVEFRWLDPSGNPVWADFVDVDGPYTTPNVPPGLPQKISDWAKNNPGVPVWYAFCTRTPNLPGDWAVQAHFYDPDDGARSLKGRNTDIITIPPPETFPHAIPEVPLGTIVVLLSMFGALGIFAMKRKASPVQMPS